MAGALSGEEQATLAQVLDALVPARDDARLPGAGALGVGDHVERAVRGLELAALAQALARLAARGFAQASPPERVALLEALAREDPATFHALLLHAYGGYYHHPRVVEALGLEPRPPFPQGYAVAPTDFALLDPVRGRAKLYRDC
jgi:hypothetical protein